MTPWNGFASPVGSGGTSVAAAEGTASVSIACGSPANPSPGRQANDRRHRPPLASGAVTGAAEGRVYGGRTSDERRAQRRGRLHAAGLELFGTAGWSGASVERLCATAGVATRSFYEEFASREALLLAVYGEILTAGTAAVAAALEATAEVLEERVPAGVSAYVNFVTADPRRAVVVHREVRVAGVLEPQRRAGFLSFALFVEQEATRIGTRAGAGRLTALALAGAVNELMIDWVAEDERPSVEPITQELTLLFLRALR